MKKVSIVMRNEDGSGAIARHAHLREDIAQKFFDEAAGDMTQAEESERLAQQDEAAATLEEDGAPPA